MAISFTHHGENLATGGTGAPAQALKKATGARIDVADGTVSSALTNAGWYRIVASTTSYVLIDAAAVNGTGGMHLPAGAEIVVWIEAVQKIGCSAGV